jgi:hypothetical protein
MSEYDIYFTLIMSIELLHSNFAHRVERFGLLIAFFILCYCYCSEPVTSRMFSLSEDKWRPSWYNTNTIHST